MALLSNRILMFPRELPSYLSTAYELRFPKVYEDEPCLKKVHRIFAQCIQLIGELLFERFSQKMLDRNVQKLTVDFSAIRARVHTSNKPICAYFVAPYDDNGAILSDRLYYYHHYKMRNFEKNYSVAPFFAPSAQRMFQILKEIRQNYPDREIQVVDCVSHGSPRGLMMPKEAPQYQGSEGMYDIDALEEDQFKDCAKDAAIILDACSTGEGEGSFAEELAKKNPGKTVFAPKTELFFSKPVIEEKNGKSSIAHVIHGLALVNARTAGAFRYSS